MRMFYELPVVNLSDEEMQEKSRIREIVEYDRYCADYGYKEQQKNLWFDDGRLFTTWFDGKVADYIGNPTIVPEAKPYQGAKDSHHHRINSTIIWLKGNKAIAEIVCFLNFRSEIAGDWMDLQCWCRFHYRVEKREGKWGIVYFEGIYEKDRMDPVFQDTNVQISRDCLTGYRPINWNMAFRRTEFKGGVSDDSRWAGDDKPETIRKLYEESSRWMGLE